MKCSRCQADNRDVARFCGACGEALLRACSACGEDTPLQAAHCDQCGRQQSAPPRPLPEPATLVPRWDSQTRGTPVRPVRFSAARPALAVPDRTDEIDLRAIQRGGSSAGEPAAVVPQPGAAPPKEEETQPVPVAAQAGTSVRARIDGLWADVLSERKLEVGVVRGDVGAGKSYAIDRFVASVPDARSFMVSGRALAVEQELAAWRSLLESAGVDAEHKRLPLSAELGTSMVSATYASLRWLQRPARVGNAVDLVPVDDATLVLLAEGLAAALRSAAETKPCVLVLDAEGALTAGVVRALLRTREDRAPCLLLVLVEQRAAGPRVIDPADAGRAHEVTIPPMTLRQMQRLAEERVSAAHCEALSTRVLEAMGGSVRELLQLLVALDPKGVPPDETLMTLARDVGARQRAVVERMPPMVRSVAGRAAVLGAVCSVNELIYFCRDVAGAEGVRAALATLTDWGVVEVVAAGTPIVRFGDAQMLTAVLDHLPVVQREHLEARAQALASPATELIDDDATDTEERPATAPPLSEAAKLIDASRLDEAERLLDTVEQGALAANAFAQVAAIGTLRGQVALKRGAVPHAKLLLAEALSMAQALGDAYAEASARAVLVRAHIRLADLGEAEAELDRLAKVTRDDVWVGQLRGEVALARKADAFLRRD